jgi:hypothetical protein
MVRVAEQLTACIKEEHPQNRMIFTKDGGLCVTDQVVSEHHACMYLRTLKTRMILPGPNCWKNSSIR